MPLDGPNSVLFPSMNTTAEGVNRAQSTYVTPSSLHHALSGRTSRLSSWLRASIITSSLPSIRARRLMRVHSPNLSYTESGCGVSSFGLLMSYFRKPLGGFAENSNLAGLSRSPRVSGTATLSVWSGHLPNFNNGVTHDLPDGSLPCKALKMGCTRVSELLNRPIRCPRCPKCPCLYDPRKRS